MCPSQTSAASVRAWKCRSGPTRKGGRTYTGRIGFISTTAEFTPKTVETTELRTALVYRLRVVVE